MRKFFFGATAKRLTLGIGVIVCLTAFFAFGLKTGVSNLGATAQRQTKVDAKSANTSARVALTARETGDSCGEVAIEDCESRCGGAAVREIAAFV